MKSYAKRQLFSGALLLTGIALAQSLALAQCPATIPGTTVTMLPQCCDLALAGKPCGVDPQRVEISGLIIPALTVTPDVGDPCKVHVSTTPGSMTVTSYGACMGAYCGAGPSYLWDPFKRDNPLTPSSLSWVRNYPNSAWIGGDPNYVNLTSLTPSQKRMTATWTMGTPVNVSIRSLVESFSLGCTTVVTKPDPVPQCSKCPPQLTPSSKSCQGGEPDPVDPYSGDYYYAEDDLTVPGIIPLRVVRAYRGHHRKRKKSYVKVLG